MPSKHKCHDFWCNFFLRQALSIFILIKNRIKCPEYKAPLRNELRGYIHNIEEEKPVNPHDHSKLLLVCLFVCVRCLKREGRQIYWKSWNNKLPERFSLDLEANSSSSFKTNTTFSSKHLRWCCLKYKGSSSTVSITLAASKISRKSKRFFFFNFSCSSCKRNNLNEDNEYSAPRCYKKH